MKTVAMIRMMNTSCTTLRTCKLTELWYTPTVWIPAKKTVDGELREFNLSIHGTISSTRRQLVFNSHRLREQSIFKPRLWKPKPSKLKTPNPEN